MAANRQPGVTSAIPLPQQGEGRTVLAQGYRPDPVCRDDSFIAVRYARQVFYMVQAIDLAKSSYVWPCVKKHAGDDFWELIHGILPGLLIALGTLIGTTSAGAVIGGIGGGLAGAGVGAAPGAMAGAEAGFSVGLWILEFLGLAMLAVYMAETLTKASDKFLRALRRAWNSCGSTPVIISAAQELGEALGGFFDALIQGLAAYIAEAGMAAAFKGLQNSKIYSGLGDFVKSDSFREATVTYWLKKIGKPNEPKLVRNRVAVVIEFLRDQAKGPGGQALPSKKIGEVLSGTDFNAPTAQGTLVETFAPGQKITQRPDEQWGGGNWFSKSGQSANSVGLAEGSRGYKVYEVVKPFEALKSRAAGIQDTWTTGSSPGGQPAQGGGSQYFAEKHVNDLVNQGFLKETYQRPPGQTPGLPPR